MTGPPCVVAGFWKNVKSLKMQNSKEQSCSEFHGEQDGRIKHHL
jgi:hypothetical protein